MVKYGSHRAPLYEIVTNCMYPNMCYAKINRPGLVPAHDKVLINMGIAFQIPMGYYG